MGELWYSVGTYVLFGACGGKVGGKRMAAEQDTGVGKEADTAEIAKATDTAEIVEAVGAAGAGAGTVEIDESVTATEVAEAGAVSEKAELAEVADTGAVRLSARMLAEYVHLGGSIESGFRSAAALQEGTRIHKLVQQSYSERDGKEVALRAELTVSDIWFVLEGRADGILHPEDGMPPIIDEIKSTAGDLASIREDTYPVHWAQAMCYAYMYGEAEGLSQMRVQLTYYQKTSGDVLRFMRSYTREELAAVVYKMLEVYAPRAKVNLRHTELRDSSMRKLAFPYTAYRSNQRAFAGAVYKSLRDGRKLFASAPTGMGKTMSTLFPAIKAIGEGVIKRLFYLTAKTLTRTAAEEALALMEHKGLHIWSVTLTAKDKVCFQEQTDCRKEVCPYADGHYDRLNAALLDLLGNETRMDRQVIEAYARKHRVCPFEYALDAAYAADAVICDYNYIFDGRVSLKRLWEEEKRHTALLIDEAHNLVDRAREMYSAEVSKSAFLTLAQGVKGRDAGLHNAAKVVNKELLALRKTCPGQGGKQTKGSGAPERAEKGAAPDTAGKAAEQAAPYGAIGSGAVAYEAAESGTVAFGAVVSGPSPNGAADSGKGPSPNGASAVLSSVSSPQRSSPGSAGVLTLREAPAALTALLTNFVAEAERCLASGILEQASAELATLLPEVYFAVRHYVRMAAEYDERYLTLGETDGRDLRLRLFCLDPSRMLNKAGKGFRSAIFFSATLSPAGYFRELLGGGEEDYQTAYPSPFRREQLQVSLSPLSTRYKDRSLTQESIARQLVKFIAGPPGNYLVFFPSYAYMFAVADIFRPLATEVDLLIQENRMAEEAREAFLTAYQPGRDKTLVGLAVMGGIFGEGIDLAGDRLTGVAVVGVGLPQISLEREMIRAHFDERDKDGYAYAYVYPGMNKVQQAGGRLIRTEDDYGKLLLLDDRFLTSRYQSLLPPEWRDAVIIR